MLGEVQVGPRLLRTQLRDRALRDLCVLDGHLPGYGAVEAVHLYYVKRTMCIVCAYQRCKVTTFFQGPSTSAIKFNFLYQFSLIFFPNHQKIPKANILYYFKICFCSL